MTENWHDSWSTALDELELDVRNIEPCGWVEGVVPVRVSGDDVVTSAKKEPAPTVRRPAPGSGRLDIQA